MVGYRDLADSVFQNRCFEHPKGTVRVVNEKKSDKGDVLLYVDLKTQGTPIKLCNRLLKDTAGIFAPENEKKGRISFRSDCDGVCLLETKGKGYLLLMEVKSGYDGIEKKGFMQIVASYVKTRCILNTIKEYKSTDYVEKAIFVSYPPMPAAIQENEDVYEYKEHMIAPSQMDVVNREYATALRVDGKVTIDLNKYNIQECHLNPALYNPVLEVVHVAVAEGIPSAELDIDAILA